MNKPKSLTLLQNASKSKMQPADNKKFIDVDSIFKSKNPGLYRFLPRFFISYLKRITHQDEINEFIKLNGHKTEFDFVDAVIDEFGVKIGVEGMENIPVTGGCIFASNHPLGRWHLLKMAASRQTVHMIFNHLSPFLIRIFRIQHFGFYWFAKYNGYCLILLFVHFIGKLKHFNIGIYSYSLPKI